MSQPLIQFGAPAAGPANPALPGTRVRLPSPPRAAASAIAVDGVAIPHAAISAEAQQHPAASPSEAFLEAAEALVVRQLLLAEAARLGLAAVALPDDRGRLETDEDALVRTLLESEVGTPEASEAECLRYYRANPGRFATPPMWEAHHILLPVPAGADAQQQGAAGERARRLIAELTDTPDRFAELARLNSACPSRHVGGSLGQLTPGSTVAEFEAALDGLAEGEISAEPVRSRYGFHVIRLDRRIAGRRLPFEQVRERIAVHLEAASWSRGVAQLIGQLAERAQIVGIVLRGAPHLSGGRR
ncbi:peptidylprolyl isomerase [Devosia sp.]|uniref:peptidylprolyl isomerase n=1 Tax=Devosia sp. TaxID=1871048 RepID=UPI0035B05825